MGNSICNPLHKLQVQRPYKLLHEHAMQLLHRSHQLRSFAVSRFIALEIRLEHPATVYDTMNFRQWTEFTMYSRECPSSCLTSDLQNYVYGFNAHQKLYHPRRKVSILYDCREIAYMLDSAANLALPLYKNRKNRNFWLFPLT